MIDNAFLKKKIIKISKSYLNTNDNPFSDEEIDALIAAIFTRYENDNENNESITMIAHDVIYDYLTQ